MKPIELIVATFENDEDRAGEVLEGFKQAAAEEVLVLKAAAVISRTKDGEIEIKDPGDVKSKQGRVFGAVSGALVGLLGGPIGVVVGGIAGAVTGGVAASIIDRGVPDKLIEDIKKGLQPGSSAIIAYVELDWVETAIASLKKEGAIVHHETLGEQLLGSYVRDINDRQDD